MPPEEPDDFLNDLISEDGDRPAPEIKVDEVKFSLVWGKGFQADVAALRAPKVKEALYAALWGLMLGNNADLVYGTPESIDGYDECFRQNG